MPSQEETQVQPARDVELTEDRREVGFDRRLGDAQLACDLLVSSPSAHQPGYLPLARAQAVERSVDGHGRRLPMASIEPWVFEKCEGRAAPDPHVAVLHSLDGPPDLQRGAAPRAVSFRARFQERTYFRLVERAAGDQYLGHQTPPPHGADSVNREQRNVHHQRIGLKASDACFQIRVRARLPDPEPLRKPSAPASSAAGPRARDEDRTVLLDGGGERAPAGDGDPDVPR